MGNVLVTGGSGFFGGVLKRRLLRDGHSIVNVDLMPDEDSHPALTSVTGDLRDAALLKRIFSQHRFEVIYHAAAQLAHGTRLDERLLWTSNVDATNLLAEAACRAGIRPFVFLSSNCLWASNLGHPVNEENDAPAPVEIYGKLRLEAERILQKFNRDLDVVIIRCPTITTQGRLGPTGESSEFIDDGKAVWVVGTGNSSRCSLFLSMVDVVDRLRILL